MRAGQRSSLPAAFAKAKALFFSFICQHGQQKEVPADQHIGTFNFSRAGVRRRICVYGMWVVRQDMQGSQPGVYKAVRAEMSMSRNIPDLGWGAMRKRGGMWSTRVRTIECCVS
jgi:hypothetical protein